MTNDRTVYSLSKELNRKYIRISDDINSINFGLSDIAQRTGYCLDRYGKIKKSYSITTDNLDSELDSNIKRKIFDLTITPRISKQNVHVLNLYKS